MKQKLIFMCINMNIGGTEKALLNMIDEIPREKYDGTILMLEEYGGFLNDIPKHIKVIYLKDYQNIKPILNQPPLMVAKDLLKKGKVIKAFNISMIHFLTKLVGERSLYFKYVLNDCKKLEEQYDVAVAYAGPMDFITYFVLNKIKAKKKVQWIHFDITKIGLNLKFADKFYNKFDKVFVVSSEGRDKLIDKVPSLKDKTEVFYNITSPKTIRELAEQGNGFDDDFDGIRILTVGRLSNEKGQDLTIPVLARLKAEGYKVKWYCIGEGGARKEYEKMIKEHSLEDDYILLGAKPNPYPYMKECDLYMQPSRHEGYCITLAEAKCFKAPIVTTNFTGANEQIAYESIGLVVNINSDDIYQGIKEILNNNKIIANLYVK